MSLSAGFSRELREASARRQLVPGAVIKLKVEMDDGKVQEKRFLVVGADTDMVAVVINSQIGPFIRNRPNMLKCQVQIDAKTHSFMNHDSHIDCSRLRIYPMAEVIKQLVQNPAWALGSISESIRVQVVAAVKASNIIAPADLAKWLPSFETSPPSPAD